MKWFRRCAFCVPPPDLVREFRDHHPWCWWRSLMRTLQWSPNGVAVAQAPSATPEKK